MVAAVALFLVFLVVRTAIVQFYGAQDPVRAARAWPGHPAVILESGLAEVGEMAAAGRPVEPALVQRLLAASAKAPLAPEPFLVRGVQAQLAGDPQLALKAFLAARERNPRLIATRYFLADHYLKAGQAGPGLTEISALARLVPQSLPSMAPYLAAYARSPGAASQMKAMLQAQPQLEPLLLDALAADAANLDLILSLWSGRSGEETRLWQTRLLGQLVASGRYGPAREAWARFTGLSADAGQMFDPEFDHEALPPFGWSLASDAAGVAEAAGNGRLHILFYGRDDSVLASQVLILKPGRYQLSMQAGFASQATTALEWTVHCLPDSTEIARVQLDRAGPIAGSFLVPAVNCRAQRLELSGVAPELPEQTDATISHLQLAPEAGR